MTNGEFQGKCVQFNAVPISGETDEWIVGELLGDQTAPYHLMATPQETGLIAPPNEGHIPLYTQEPSPLSRQGMHHISDETYTSHVTTYQYPKSSVIPNQKCSQPHITSTCGQIPYLHQTQQQFPPAIESQCTE